jgi:2-methylcitrate dehydratase PrpD
LSLISEFTKNIFEINYETLPDEAILATKKLILDTIGVILAGSKSKDIRKLVDLIGEWGGKKESTILGFGLKAPCSDAALVNGFSAGVLDYDDFHEIDFVRTSQGVVPAALAIAERKGNVDGKSFIAAVTLGFDLSCRISRAAVRREGITNPLQAHGLAGYLTAPNIFGAAAAASKILGLNEGKIKNALGISLMQVCMEGWSIAGGLNTKGFDFGLRSKSGVLAALMAEKCFEGMTDPFEGDRGFYAVCYKNIYNAASATENLGRVFEVTTNSQRAYPLGFVFNPAISATLSLVKENDIKSDDVMEVILHAGPTLQPGCEPLEKKRSPRDSIAAQHSLPWLIAKAIINRKLGLEHFTDEQIKDMKTLELARKVVPITLQETTASSIKGIIEIKSKGGQLYSKTVEYSRGSYKDPMTFEEVAEKFTDCCLYSAKPIATGNQDKVINMVRNLEKVADIRQITEQLI